MNFITGKQLYYAFAAGGEAVIAEREILNRMNVFPVPDGDTGSNLSYTLKSIIENTEIHNDAGATMRSLAQSALVGARGNSGILFAQFVNGMAEAVGDQSRITLEQFVDSVNHAVTRAYEAISNPVEGTMLTVMRDWAHSIKEELNHVKDYPNLFRRTLDRAKQSLQDTMYKLEHLRKAGVTDAGARGFVNFISGFHDFLEAGAEVDHLHDRPAISGSLAVDEDPHADLEDLEDLSFRFCTEGIVSGTDIAAGGVREALNDLGDSLIVAGGGPHARIHIHSNNPAEVFYRLKQFGTVSNQKVDDMFRQFQMMKSPKARIGLVIDSTCDLPPELLDEHQIHMAPLTINFGDSSFLDRLTLKSEQFYRLLDEESDFPTTSQPSPSIFSRLYGHLSSHYDSIIAVHISRPLSGTYNTSAQEASQIEGTKISVLDSKTISASLGLMVLEAAQAIEEGKSHEEVVELLDNLSHRTDMWVTTPSLNNFIRGGRVSKFKGGIGKLLGMRPIIGVTPEGASRFRDKAFSYKGALKKIIDQVIRGHQERGIQSFSVVHAAAQEEAEWVAREIEQATGVKSSFISEISPVLGAHAGLGAVNLGLLYKK
ncbi:DAK2 domain-containing protein [Spirochaeta lutea]|uniref:DhaL domain-containing protein n=1 Tax=Spirochaeta lutea TaxID=1480694 RepID=A0A098QWF0_9SPIO|nr:DegV family protein [Spirochaeta lutea]KGE71866.1 hypothetical protein DC28_08565 [Spirochaeta lutea]